MQGNANPMTPQIRCSPLRIAKGSRGYVIVTIGNNGNDPIRAGSLEATIAVTDIIPMSGVAKLKGTDYKRWVVHSHDKETNTIKLRNVAPFDNADMGKVYINMKGAKKGRGLLAVHVSYIFSNDGSPQPSLQGNTSSADDNSTTSVEVY